MLPNLHALVLCDTGVAEKRKREEGPEPLYIKDWTRTSFRSPTFLRVSDFSDGNTTRSVVLRLHEDYNALVVTIPQQSALNGYESLCAYLQVENGYARLDNLFYELNDVKLAGCAVTPSASQKGIGRLVLESLYALLFGLFRREKSIPFMTLTDGSAFRKGEAPSLGIDQDMTLTLVFTRGFGFYEGLGFVPSALLLSAEEAHPASEDDLIEALIAGMKTDLLWTHLLFTTPLNELAATMSSFYWNVPAKAPPLTKLLYAETNLGDIDEFDETVDKMTDLAASGGIGRADAEDMSIREVLRDERIDLGARNAMLKHVMDGAWKRQNGYNQTYPDSSLSKQIWRSRPEGLHLVVVPSDDPALPPRVVRASLATELVVEVLDEAAVRAEQRLGLAKLEPFLFPGEMRAELLAQSKIALQLMKRPDASLVDTDMLAVADRLRFQAKTRILEDVQPIINEHSLQFVLSQSGTRELRFKFSFEQKVKEGRHFKINTLNHVTCFQLRVILFDEYTDKGPPSVPPAHHYYLEMAARDADFEDCAEEFGVESGAKMAGNFHSIHEAFAFAFRTYSKIVPAEPKPNRTTNKQPVKPHTEEPVDPVALLRYGTTWREQQSLFDSRVCKRIVETVDPSKWGAVLQAVVNTDIAFTHVFATTPLDQLFAAVEAFVAPLSVVELTSDSSAYWPATLQRIVPLAERMLADLFAKLRQFQHLEDQVRASLGKPLVECSLRELVTASETGRLSLARDETGESLDSNGSKSWFRFKLAGPIVDQLWKRGTFRNYPDNGALLPFLAKDRVPRHVVPQLADDGSMPIAVAVPLEDWAISFGG